MRLKYSTKFVAPIISGVKTTTIRTDINRQLKPFQNVQMITDYAQGINEVFKNDTILRIDQIHIEILDKEPQLLDSKLTELNIFIKKKGGQDFGKLLKIEIDEFLIHEGLKENELINFIKKKKTTVAVKSLLGIIYVYDGRLISFKYPFHLKRLL